MAVDPVVRDSRDLAPGTPRRKKVDIRHGKIEGGEPSKGPSNHMRAYGSPAEWENGTMADLNREIEAYEGLRINLEEQHVGKWVVVHDCQVAGVYADMESAAEDAVKKFGKGPYLLRQIGAPPIVLPASVMYAPVHEHHEMRIR
jgi:hypothetical protein